MAHRGFNHPDRNFFVRRRRMSQFENAENFALAQNAWGVERKWRVWPLSL